jgi:Tfp pilus assembly protein PilF
MLCLNTLAPEIMDIRKNYDQAEAYYKKSLELEPDNANTNGNYAIFLKDIHKNYDQAEEYYKKSLFYRLLSIIRTMCQTIKP